VACTIMVADCLPVLLTDKHGVAVAAAHAGWRGLCDGVLEAVFEAFRANVQVDQQYFTTKFIASDTLAWLGPCIGPRQFEVGAEVREAFIERDPQAAAHFYLRDRAAPAAQAPKYLANLPALARQRLAALGITQIYGNDGSPPWCTVSNPTRYFSHRAGIGQGGSGRMAACIWLAGG
jgi:YfiH family protein